MENLMPQPCLSSHLSPLSVVRASRFCCEGAHGPEGGAGVVDTTLSRPAGVRPLTAEYRRPQQESGERCGLVITSWPDLDGARLQARHWVENKLAASVNILPKMDSIYIWRGELCSGREHKMFIKTSANRLEALQQEIESTHPYAVAEILQFKIDSGNREYLDWIKLSTQ